jgi:alginate O-acetyltransferase complex protein AlgI
LLFNTLPFGLFFLLLLLLFYTLKSSWQSYLLLGASYLFYAFWSPVFLLLILSSTVVDYFCGKAMSSRDKPKRLPFLLLSLLTNLGLLFYFKYQCFFLNDICAGLLGLESCSSPDCLWYIILPVGISFYTFQTLSYSIDIYKGELKAEHNFFDFALFVSFFPQLVAGPIERAGSLLPQLKTAKSFDYLLAVSGLRLFLWGLFKKIVIADRLGLIVDEVYGNVYAYHDLTLLLATLCFAIQIYCDFSGYSDMALGIARCFGVRLSQNFDKPYFASSLRDFWRRWHITLSCWFRDYVYLPLGGSKKGLEKMFLAILIVFLLSGFWHGANWTFLAWGAAHGLILILEILFTKFVFNFTHSKNTGIKISTWLLTFLIVLFTWVLFRADSMADASYIYQQLFSFNFQWDAQLLDSFYIGKRGLLLAIGLIIFLFSIEAADSRWKWSIHFGTWPWYIRWAVYFGTIFLIIVLGVYETRPFIYFQF